jgi:LysR family glycine cleavage system transcriptional activator
LRFEPLIEVSRIAGWSPQLARRLKKPADLAEHPLIHLTVQPNAWPVWLGEASLQRAASPGDLWFDNVLSALEAARAGFGVALAMHPLITTSGDFGRALVAPFQVPKGRGNKFYLVYRSEHARTRRIVMLKRWLADAVKAASGA